MCIYIALVGVCMYIHTHAYKRFRRVLPENKTMAKTLGWMMGYIHNIETGSFGYSAALFALFCTWAMTPCAL